jgi:hypothetical protein
MTLNEIDLLLPPAALLLAAWLCLPELLILWRGPHIENGFRGGSEEVTPYWLHEIDQDLYDQLTAQGFQPVGRYWEKAQLTRTFDEFVFAGPQVPGFGMLYPNSQILPRRAAFLTVFTSGAVLFTKNYSRGLEAEAEEFVAGAPGKLRALRSQFATASENEPRKRSKTVTAPKRNVRYQPYAFTEHGAIMAATILNSPRAVEVSDFVGRGQDLLQGVGFELPGLVPAAGALPRPSSIAWPGPAPSHPLLVQDGRGAGPSPSVLGGTGCTRPRVVYFRGAATAVGQTPAAIGLPLLLSQEKQSFVLVGDPAVTVTFRPKYYEAALGSPRPSWSTVAAGMASAASPAGWAVSRVLCAAFPARGRVDPRAGWGLDSVAVP